MHFVLKWCGDFVEFDDDGTKRDYFMCFFMVK